MVWVGGQGVPGSCLNIIQRFEIKAVTDLQMKQGKFISNKLIEEIRKHWKGALGHKREGAQGSQVSTWGLFSWGLKEGEAGSKGVQVR